MAVAAVELQSNGSRTAVESQSSRSTGTAVSFVCLGYCREVILEFQSFKGLDYHPLIKADTKSLDFVMSPPLIGGGIKRCFCLTSVCPTSVCRVHRA